MSLPDKKWPTHGWFGLALVAVFWGLNWGLPGLRTHVLFFPLWLGYCLTIDALVFRRKGTSLLTRNPRAYAGLFLGSAPCWWLFDLLNFRLQNWAYLGMDITGSVMNACLATLSFSTVVPAVFGSAELASTFHWIRRIKSGPKIAPTLSTLYSLLFIGLTMFTLMLIWPRAFFAFIWLSVYFILEPVNSWLGNRTLISQTAKGDWRAVLALWVGVLICGFFWEMWNFFSYPKWVYDVPGLNFWHVFEMPLLGYLGYLPFALELFAMYHLGIGLLRVPQLRTYVQFLPDAQPETEKMS